MKNALGEFEHVLLFALVGLGGEAHGVALRQLVEKDTGRRRSPGAIHITLERLEARGFVTSRLGEPTPIRGGRRKRLYTLTPAGALALKASHEQLQSIAAGRVERLEEFLQKAGSR
jgi:DNA-binding PadR family transcriptional regulator